MIVFLMLATAVVSFVEEPVCGNGVIEDGEVCESNDFLDCTTYDGYFGTQYCSDTCSEYNPCETEEYCGDWMINGPEACDGESQSCTTDDGYSGTQSCSDTCSEYNLCEAEEYCGDGITNGQEMCDGDSQSCTTDDSYSGTQSCSETCSEYNLCEAEEYCGDGITNGQEICDDGDMNGVEGFCNSECTEQIPSEPVTIHSVKITPDHFACALPDEDNPNADITLSVDADDNVGVAWVRADIGEIVPPSEELNGVKSTGRDIGEGNIVDLQYNLETEKWEYTFSITDTSAYAFEEKSITITADDDAGNGYQVADGGSDTAAVVLYSMSTPPVLSECQQLGYDTTNLCNEQDFTNINFIYEIEQYGSPECNNGMEMPWGFQYEAVVRWDFESVNFDDENIEEKLLAVADALHVFITLPGEFGNSFINVNTSAFAALDTATTITLYGLPFAAEPTIMEPEGREETISNIDFWNDDPWEIEIYDEETGDYLFTQYVPYGTLTFTVEGFSQYDITDDEVPIVEINSPDDAEYITSSAFEGEVYVDGTGSQISEIQVLLDEEEVLSYDYWDIMELCSSEDDSFTQVYCDFQLEDLAEGKHALKILATDLGGNAGNSAQQEISFSRDSTAPEIKYLLITPGEAGVEETITVITKAVDAGSGLQSLALTLQENETGYGADDTSEGIYTFSFPLTDFSQGTYTLMVTATDNLGYSSTETKTFNVTENTSSEFAYLDSRAAFNTTTEKNISVPELNVRLLISVLENSTTSVLLEKPTVVVGADATGLHLDNFVAIVAPDLEGNINSSRITFNYTDAEVAAVGIDEFTLRLYFYNETSGVWTKYDGNDGEAPDGGVDTEANEVWALTNHFSTWGMFGSAPAAPAPAPSNSGGGGGGRRSVASATLPSPVKNVAETITSPIPVFSSFGNQPPVIGKVLNTATEAQESSGLPSATDNSNGNLLTGQAVAVPQGKSIFKRFASASPLFIAGSVVAVLVLVGGGLGVRRWKRKVK